MKNFEKYEEDIKKTGYKFAVNRRTKKIVKCDDRFLCCDCIFSSCNVSDPTIQKIKWLYEEYKQKPILTIKEAEELLKDKYPEGVEIIDE